MKNNILYYDYLVIGSGFGGSVSALRLSQKGYSVGVLEAGKRYHTADFPKSNWNVRKFLWLPALGCYGIQRLNLLQHVLILSGAGVGGGSLVYANTLYRPLDKFYDHPAVRLVGSKKKLAPYYALAEKMLGVTQNTREWKADALMKATAEEMGFAKSYRTTPVGVYFGDVQKEKDPFFGGEGPKRLGCTDCGGCMVGCRYNAKNTLDKNYLYFAEKLGAKIHPESRVIDIRPLSEDGSAGYEVTVDSPTKLFGGTKRKFRAKGIVLSAGVLGTVGLLLRLKEQGRLPNLSPCLGDIVRTNSEAIIGVTSKEKKANFSEGVAITSSVHPDGHTHIEPVRYSEGSDLMGLLATLMTDGGGRIPRPLRFFGNILRHPLLFLQALWPLGFAKRSIILLVMQTLDNSMRLVRRRRWIFPFKKTLSSKEAAGQQKIPTYIPVGNQFARLLAKRMNGIPKSSLNEVLLDVPTTAHILGGACFGKDPSEGVIDANGHVFGYENMLIADGSVIPANPGVNPSLSITAFAEHTMAAIPPKEGKKVRLFPFEKKWGVAKLFGKAKTTPMRPPKKASKKKTSKKKKRITKTR